MTTTATDKIADFCNGVPGVYESVPSDVYHAAEGYSSTFLKNVHNYCPATAKHLRDNRRQPTPEMVVGSAAHALVSGTFDEEFVASEGCACNKQDGKPCSNDGVIYDGYRWFCGVHKKAAGDDAIGGRTVVSTDQWNRARSIFEAVRNHPTAGAILDLATDRELSILHVDEETGLLLKVRLDLLCRTADGNIMPDLKTCASAKPAKFQRQAADLGYPLQLAFYRRVAIAAGIPVDTLSIIAAENDEPYPVTVFEPSADFMEAGVRHMTAALRTVARCEESGVWGGYCEDIQTLELPKWAI